MNKRGLGLITIIVLVVAGAFFLGYITFKDPNLAPRSSSKFEERFHFECVNNQCQRVNGGGPNTCSSDSECVTIVSNETNVTLPDLIVESVEILSIMDLPGNLTNVTMKVTVKNIGNTIADASSTRVSIEPVRIFRPTPQISPNIGKSVYASFILSPGSTYTANGDADFNNDVAELDETNNDGRLVFEI
jgi:hypothetical protein